MISPSAVFDDYLDAVGDEGNNEETEKGSTTQLNDTEALSFDPVAPVEHKPNDEPFPDENDEGPDAFVYYTIPQSVRAAFEKDSNEPDYRDGNLQSKLKVVGELGPREKQVYRYFRRRLIMDLLNFLLCHLLAHEPDDPIEFLLGVLDNCLLFRSGHIEHPPTLFEKHHLEAMFRTFDPLKRKALTDSLLDFIVIPQDVKSSSEDLGKDGTAVRMAKELPETVKAHKYMKQILRDSRTTGKLFGRPFQEATAAAAASSVNETVWDESQREVPRAFGVSVKPLKSLQAAFRPTSQ